MIRKIIKVFFIVLGTLLVLLMVLPFAFKGRIVELVKQEINEQLDAEVAFGRFGLSFIRQFPQMTFWMNELQVIGRGGFAGDTLADIGRLMVTVDVLKLLRSEQIDINRIRLDHPTLLLKMLADGQANWDILGSGETEEVVAGDGDADLVFGLRRVEIRSGRVSYVDDKYLTYIHADDINGVFSGDLSVSQTTLSTRDATIGSFSLRYDEWPILSRVGVRLTAKMDADLDRLVFVFRDNLIRINELPLVFEGMVGWPDDALEMDFRFGSARADFGSFLSLVPAIYTKDFRSLETAGSLKLEGHVKGEYTDSEYPGFGLDIEIENGMFRYPDLPAAVERVQLRANVFNPGRDLDLTEVDVPVFHAELAGTPVDASFHLKRPLSDPDFDVRLAGRLDLADVERFYPLDETYVLRGTIDSEVEMRGSMSMVERSDFDTFHANGVFVARDLYLQTPMTVDPLQIDMADFRFQPREVSLDDFSMRFGKNDLTASGGIFNLPAFLFSGALLRGHFTTRSSYFDLNTLMDQLPESDQEALSDTATANGNTEDDVSEGDNTKGSGLSVIRIPDNIDFNLDATFDRVLFGNLELTDVKGIIQVAEEQVHMESLRLNMLGGSLELTGVYDTRDEKPWVNLGLNILDFDIGKTFGSFVTVGILAPVAEYARGAFSARLQLSTLLHENLQPALSSLRGKGGLRSSALVLEGTPSMSALASQLQADQFRSVSLKDVALSFAFSDGKVEVPPFDMNFGGVKASVIGMTYFDQRISYVMLMDIPRAFFGERASQVLDDLVSRAAAAGLRLEPGEVIPLEVKIGGTFRKPDVSFSMATARDNLEQQLRQEAERLSQEAEARIRAELDAARERVETEVQDRVDEASEAMRTELEARANKVMEEARLQAAALRSQAEMAAAAVREEAGTQSLRLQQEASSQGPIAQAAAQQAAQQMIREADRRATQIEAEAERNIQRLLDAAEEQAGRIRKGEEE